ncbi:MAG TPA: AraC family transcriptional regulator [Paludibacter sp.]|nr:AraC family transcriptional regulator [Paludibacter sp.]
MLPNNLHAFSDLLLVNGNMDSRFIRETFWNSGKVLSGLSAQIASKSDITTCREEERQLLENVISVVKGKITDGSFDFNQFAVDMKVSKSTLHRKVSQLTGLTPCKLIQSFRIEIALQMLLDNSLNISEVAYRTGFNDPRYFSRCFKNELGLSPKEYRESIRQKSVVIDVQRNDDLFLEKALEKLEAKISDGNLSFDQFASEMNVSKASLYRKLKSVAGLSPCEFIRSVRIKRSAQLLAKHSNISEVAFAVGFNDSKYFSRCFKSEFGVTPTQYQELLAC